MPSISDLWNNIRLVSHHRPKSRMTSFARKEVQLQSQPSFLLHFNAKRANIHAAHSGQYRVRSYKCLVCLGVMFDQSGKDPPLSPPNLFPPCLSSLSLVYPVLFVLLASVRKDFAYLKQDLLWRKEWPNLEIDVYEKSPFHRSSRIGH